MTSLLSPKSVISVSVVTKGVVGSTGILSAYAAGSLAGNGQEPWVRIPHGFLATSSGSSWVKLIPKTVARILGRIVVAMFFGVKFT